MLKSSSVALADQLERRSKELDARETYLAVHEELAKEVEVAITKAQRELALLDETIVKRQTILDAQRVQLDTLQTEYVNKTKIVVNLLAKEQERYELWQSKVEKAQQDLKVVKDSILERTDYLKKQEILIQEQVTEGNSRLRGLDYEVTELKQVIRDLEVKKKSLKATIIDLDIDLTAARESFMPELAEHERQIAVILVRTQTAATDTKTAEDMLQKVNKQVSAALIKRQQIVDDVDAKLVILNTKELEIMTKREALRVEREEMEEAKHYFTTPKSLYDV